VTRAFVNRALPVRPARLIAPAYLTELARATPFTAHKIQSADPLNAPPEPPVVHAFPTAPATRALCAIPAFALQVHVKRELLAAHACLMGLAWAMTFIALRTEAASRPPALKEPKAALALATVYVTSHLNVSGELAPARPVAIKNPRLIPNATPPAKMT